jgi:Fur family ferric uptake transcriptional regulator
MPIGFELPAVEVDLSPDERFAAFLDGQGRRITKQKRRIVEAIYSHHDHFDAEELLRHLQDATDGKEVSRPTVYRTLLELVEAGILRRVQINHNGRVLYEHQYAYPSHDHLMCGSCGRLIEFHSEHLEQIAHRAAESHHFKARTYRMTVLGTCRECQEKTDEHAGEQDTARRADSAVRHGETEPGG